MAASPMQGTEGDLYFSVFNGETDIADRAEVLSIEITHAVNRIPAARIVLLDDSDTEPAQRLAVSDADLCAPGAPIRIEAGWGASQKELFRGIVVRHGVRIGALGRSQLVIECRDPAVAMTAGRKCANHVDMSDSDIMSRLLSDHGLDGKVGSTGAKFTELVQYEVSDWDFLLARAEANGMIVVAGAGKVTVAPPDMAGSPALVVTYGEDLLEFEGEVDARQQFAAVSSAAWDPATQELVEHQAGPAELNAHGNLGAKALADVLALKAFRLRSTVPLDVDALKAWAAARQLKAGLARVRGRVRFRGSPLARPGTLLEVAGAGARFSGNAWLGGVTHMLADGDWITEAEFGLAPEALAERQALAAPLAGGLTAGVSGLQIGVVSKLDKDPDRQHKVQVTLPVTQAETAGVWARLAGDYGSSGNGNFFIPEIGDEVVLGFLNSDPSHPVILGSLYSAKRAPPHPLTAENNIKAIVTRSRLSIEFDEEKKVITLATPGGNRITLSDDAKSITLRDQNDNAVTLSPEGIALDSPKDIAITAKGKITLDATGNVVASSKADLQLDATNIACKAQAAFSAKASAGAELSASGQTTVKGAMVMIN